jgi:hypothetical protein
MRLDNAIVFVSPDGEPLSGDNQGAAWGTIQSARWPELLARFKSLATRAMGDWEHSYVVVPPVAGDPLESRSKAALGQVIASENLLPPVSWHVDIARDNRHVMPLMERVLVIGSRNDVVSSTQSIRAIHPRALLCGQHDLAGQDAPIGYRYIGDVPIQRLLLCVASMFTSVILLNRNQEHSPLIDLAMRHSVPVVQL